MINWLRQFFCKHSYNLDRYHNNNPTMWILKCKKCKKEGIWL